MNIRLYFAELTTVFDKARFHLLMNDIPASWHPSIAKYNRPVDQMRSAAAKWILQRELSKQHPAAIVTFDDGMPVVGGSMARVSIAHGSEMVACAISDCNAVGIDVERINPVDLAQFNSVLSKEEIVMLDRNPTQKDALFFDIWTRKESISKACGRGVYLGFKSFNAHDAAVTAEGALWRAITLDISSRYAAAVAFPAKEEPAISVHLEKLLL